MQHTELNKDLVRNRLDYGTYEAAQARDTQGRRPFRSHEVIHKIYLTDGGIEIPNWYQCTRCNEILFCVSRHGTKPLNAHADYKCTELTNEQKEAGRLAHRSRANENHRDPNPMPNAPPNNLIQAANVAPVNSTPATTTTTTSATNPALDTPNEVPASASQAAQLTADELAIALWRATTLGATYGVVPVTTFRRFLDRDQPWIMPQIMDNVTARISQPFQPIIPLRRATNTNVAVAVVSPVQAQVRNNQGARATRTITATTTTATTTTATTTATTADGGVNFGVPTDRELRARRRNRNR